MATDAGLDLVEISPNASPPVCKIMDFGKYKYEQQKKEAEARKKQKIIEVKEIKFRPNTDTHDYEIKMRSVKKFLENGDKVKVTLRFRGREMAHVELGQNLLERVVEAQEVLYEGVYLLGASKLLKWQKATNMIRPNSNTNKVLMNYVVAAPRMYKGKIDSLVSKMTPYADLIREPRPQAKTTKN